VKKVLDAVKLPPALLLVARWRRNIPVRFMRLKEMASLRFLEDKADRVKVDRNI